MLRNVLWLLGYWLSRPRSPSADVRAKHVYTDEELRSHGYARNARGLVARMQGPVPGITSVRRRKG